MKSKVTRAEPAAAKTSTTNYTNKEGQRSSLTILKQIQVELKKPTSFCQVTFWLPKWRSPTTPWKVHLKHPKRSRKNLETLLTQTKTNEPRKKKTSLTPPATLPLDSQSIGDFSSASMGRDVSEARVKQKKHHGFDIHHQPRFAWNSKDSGGQQLFDKKNIDKQLNNLVIVWIHPYLAQTRAVPPPWNRGVQRLDS